MGPPWGCPWERPSQVLEPSSCAHPPSHRGQRCVTWSYVLILGTQAGKFSVDHSGGEREGGGEDGLEALVRGP